MSTLSIQRPKFKKKYQWVGLLFVMPVVLGTLIFNVLPVLASLVISFTHWDLITPPEFAGVENYLALTEDPFAVNAMKNTVFFALGSVILGLALSLGLALLVNQRLTGIQLFRLAYFMPFIVTVSAVGLVWQLLLNGKLGLVNLALGSIGIQGPSWLVDPQWTIFSVIIISVWQGAGYSMMIFLAGLQNVPQDLYDSAKIDGAGRWASFRYVTWPMLSPTTFFILIITIINSFQVFTLIYVLTTVGGPEGRLRALDVWVFNIWQQAFSYFRMGYASSMAWVLFIIIALITLFQWQYGKRWVHYQ